VARPYGRLLNGLATLTGDLPHVDLTVELIKHCLTPASKHVGAEAPAHETEDG
jgi:hypothetical protein